MKGKNLWIVIVLLTAAVALTALIQSRNQRTVEQSHKSQSTQSSSNSTTTDAMKSRNVPAHYEAPPDQTDLRPVLASTQFAGKTREAYEAVKQISVTIAQIPCYCHCDRGMGHKSLHSCFEDDHAAHCAICVDEALMAYRLQKEGLSADQIRAQIIAEFSEQ